MKIPNYFHIFIICGILLSFTIGWLIFADLGEDTIQPLISIMDFSKNNFLDKFYIYSKGYAYKFINKKI